MLASSSSPLSVDELAAESGATPELLGTANAFVPAFSQRNECQLITCFADRAYPPLSIIQRLHRTNINLQVHSKQHHEDSSRAKL